MEKGTLYCYDEDSQIEEIRKENNYYKSIIENHSLYIIKTDLEGKYTYMNPYFLEIMGLNAREWLGRNSLSMIIPEDHDVFRLTVNKCFQEPDKTHWVTLRKQAKNGVIATQWGFMLQLDESGIPQEIISVGHDVTGMMLQQKELRELVDVTSEQNERLRGFTYTVSHNMRSHVANIIGLVNLDDTDNQEERNVAWDMIKTIACNLDETLCNLNEVISIQTNTGLPVSVVDVRLAFDKVLKSISVLISSADTSITFRSDGDQSLHVNAAYFESILLNLLTNAVKYKQKNRALTIDLRLHDIGDYKMLLFKDNGVGIDLAKYKDQLFKMYKTFHGNSDAKGMGLFLVKSQIEAMKGKIEVESELGKGTAFKLYFPNDLR